MIIDDEKEALAAEYVLGTLDPDERAEAQALIAVDQGFAAIVSKWERRLGELNVLVAPVEPPAHLWDKIKAQVADATQSGDVKLPDIDTTPGTSVDSGQDGEDATSYLRRKLRRAHFRTALIGVIAAGLAAFIAVSGTRPDMLPQPLRPKPLIERVEVVKTVEVPSPRPAQFVSALQKDQFAPAFLLTFDLDRRVFTVRAIIAPRQPGKSYELWMASEKFAGPRSLGIVGTQEFTIRPALASVDSTTLHSATYTVSLEPEGGSPTGAPTGPVLYSGKLLQATPPGFPAPTP